MESASYSSSPPYISQPGLNPGLPSTSLIRQNKFSQCQDSNVPPFSFTSSVLNLHERPQLRLLTCVGRCLEKKTQKLKISEREEENRTPGTEPPITAREAEILQLSSPAIQEHHV